MENKNHITGAWDWNNINDDHWLTPAPVVYPLSIRWKKENKNKILDLGCGLGRNSLYFYEQGFNVTAVDGSLSAIEKFEAICKQKDYKIDVRLCDMHSLSFENSTFDAVFSFHVIYHTDSKGIKKVISEIERVLKPTGELFVTLNSKNNTSYLKNINYKIDENTIIKQDGIEKGIPHYFVNEEEAKMLLSNFEIQKLLYVEDIKNDGSRSCHYYILARK